MKRVKREYRNRRVYFLQYAPTPIAHWQTDDYRSKYINWISSNNFYKYFGTVLPEIDTFSKYIKENIPGARVVYDMLLMLYGIEFESDSTFAWFMLKYA